MTTNAENQPEPTRDGGGIEYNPNPEPPQPGYERITDVLGRPIVDVYNPHLAADPPQQNPRSYYNYRILGSPTPHPPRTTRMQGFSPQLDINSQTVSP